MQQPQPELKPEPEGDAAQPPLEDEGAVLERATLKLNTCKIIVAGDGRAGKTSLLRNLRREPFDPEEESTRGVAACTVDVREESWDNAGGSSTKLREQAGPGLPPRGPAGGQGRAGARARLISIETAEESGPTEGGPTEGRRAQA